MKYIALTFDVDWAPEWCIENCIAICREAGVKATFFVTHSSPALQAVAADPQFELGIHPNFLDRSHHGRSTREVIDSCLAMVPGAQAMRTHALVQSSPMFAEIADHYPSIETDVSLFLPFHKSLQPTDLYIGAASRRLTRLAYFWEDDMMAAWPGWDWTVVPETDGLAIYDFHPVFITLNMTAVRGYQRIKNMTPWRPLNERMPEEFVPHVESGWGCGTFLRALINSRPRKDFLTISEITAAHRAGS